MGFNPNYQSEGRIYAQYILKNYPNAKIGILYQNDDLGRDYLIGLKAGLGDKAASMIVAETSYELTDPTIDSQIVKLKAVGADLLFDASTPKFAAQAIKKVADLGWKPVHILDIGKKPANTTCDTFRSIPTDENGAIAKVGQSTPNLTSCGPCTSGVTRSSRMRSRCDLSENRACFRPVPL
jgi:ABC-type branched-subunit amino acid transport system substrate-binding protein